MRACALLVILTSVLAVACASNQPPLTAAQKDALQKLDAGTHELIAKDELSKLRNVGRFQIIPSIGARLWRLDTVTGSSCLLLASAEEWKKNPDLQAEACANRIAQ